MDFRSGSDPARCQPHGRQPVMLGVSSLFLTSFVAICSIHGRNPYSQERESYPFWSPPEAHPASGFTVLIPWLSGSSHFFVGEQQVGFIFHSMFDHGSSVDSDDSNPLEYWTLWKPDQISGLFAQRGYFQKKILPTIGAMGVGKGSWDTPQGVKTAGLA